MRGETSVEGTVTLSVKDFLELKKDAEYYSRTLYEFIPLFEEIEEFLKVEEFKTDLTEKIGKILDEWYG